MELHKARLAGLVLIAIGLIFWTTAAECYDQKSNSFSGFGIILFLMALAPIGVGPFIALRPPWR